MADKKTQYIGVADYVVFCSMLVISSAIGFFYAYKDRKRNDMENFHRGNKKINPVAVSLPLTVTVISALAIIGITAEVYSFGTMISWEVVGMLVGTAGGAHIFIPFFYKMDKITVFDFFQKRFGKVPRILSSILFLLNTLIVISFALYAPCLAFEAMTGISLWLVMAVAGFVCMTYTLLGGMKAVVWADTVQFVIIVAGMICILIQGSKAVGGFTKAWEVANNHNRIQFLEFSFDPRTRHTVWSIVFGFTFVWGIHFGTNQATIQRACSLPNLKTAKLAAWASYPGLLLIVVLTVFNGIVMFAYYHTCDPVTEGRIKKVDQLFPLMIVDILGDLPGLPGLLLACLFSAALSSISSGLNAISAVIVEDFIIPNTRKTLSEKTQLTLSKIAVVVVAVIEFVLAVAFSTIGGLVHQLIVSIAGLVGGPLFGVFLSGMLFPWTNTRGICVGLVVTFSLSGWLIFGTLIDMPPPTRLLTSIEGCVTESSFANTTHTTSTMMASTFTDSPAVEYSAVQEFYRLSYMWYNVLGTLVFMFVCLITSFLTGPTDPKDVDGDLMIPLFYQVTPFLPENYRKKLLFGVNYKWLQEKDVKCHKPAYLSNESVVTTETSLNEKSPTHFSTHI